MLRCLFDLSAYMPSLDLSGTRSGTSQDRHKWRPAALVFELLDCGVEQLDIWAFGADDNSQASAGLIFFHSACNMRVPHRSHGPLPRSVAN